MPTLIGEALLFADPLNPDSYDQVADTYVDLARNNNITSGNKVTFDQTEANYGFAHSGVLEPEQTPQQYQDDGNTGMAVQTVTGIGNAGGNWQHSVSIWTKPPNNSNSTVIAFGSHVVEESHEVVTPGKYLMPTLIEGALLFADPLKPASYDQAANTYVDLSQNKTIESFSGELYLRSGVSFNNTAELYGFLHPDVNRGTSGQSTTQWESEGNNGMNTHTVTGIGNSGGNWQHSVAIWMRPVKSNPSFGGGATAIAIGAHVVEESHEVVTPGKFLMPTLIGDALLFADPLNPASYDKASKTYVDLAQNKTIVSGSNVTFDNTVALYGFNHGSTGQTSAELQNNGNNGTSTQQVTNIGNLGGNWQHSVAIWIKPQLYSEAAAIAVGSHVPDSAIEVTTTTYLKPTLIPDAIVFADPLNPASYDQASGTYVDLSTTPKAITLGSLITFDSTASNFGFQHPGGPTSISGAAGNGSGSDVIAQYGLDYNTWNATGDSAEICQISNLNNIYKSATDGDWEHSVSIWMKPNGLNAGGVVIGHNGGGYIESHYTGLVWVRQTERITPSNWMNLTVYGTTLVMFRGQANIYDNQNYYQTRGTNYHNKQGGSLTANEGLVGGLNYINDGNTWAHVVYTYAANTMNVYVDGIHIGGCNHIASHRYHTIKTKIMGNTNIHIGGIPGQWSGGRSGGDGLSSGPWSVYDKTLSQEEIQSLYHSTRDNSMTNFGNTSFQYGKTIIPGSVNYGQTTEYVGSTIEVTTTTYLKPTLIPDAIVFADPLNPASYDQASGTYVDLSTTPKTITLGSLITFDSTESNFGFTHLGGPNSTSGASGKGFGPDVIAQYGLDYVTWNATGDSAEICQTVKLGNTSYGEWEHSVSIWMKPNGLNAGGIVIGHNGNLPGGKIYQHYIGLVWVRQTDPVQYGPNIPDPVVYGTTLIMFKGQENIYLNRNYYLARGTNYHYKQQGTLIAIDGLVGGLNYVNDGNTWAHVVYTYAANTMHVYVDGIHIGSQTVQTTAFPMNILPNTDLHIGGIPGQWSGGRSGGDGLSSGPWSVYDKILSQEEIQSLYHSTRDNSMINFGNTSFQYGKTIIPGSVNYGQTTETVPKVVGENPRHKYIGIGWGIKASDTLSLKIIRGGTDNNDQQVSADIRSLNDYELFQSGSPSPNFEWVHLLYTYSGRTMDVYVDTVHVGSHTFAEDLDITPDTNAYVGGIPGQWNGGETHTGPWSIYEKILTPEEIQSLYHSTRDNSGSVGVPFQYGKSITGAVQIYGGGTETVVTQVGENPFNKYIGIGWANKGSELSQLTIVRGEAGLTQYWNTTDPAQSSNGEINARIYPISTYHNETADQEDGTTWVHVVYTYTSSTRTVNVYADAIHVGSHTFSIDIDISPDANVYVGGITGMWGHGRLYTGPWSIYEKILTVEEIQSLYHSTRDNSLAKFGNNSFQYGKSLTSGAQLYGGGTETVITQVGETPINKYIGIGWYSDTADRVVPTVVRGESIWPTSFGSGGTRFMYEKDSVRVNILSDTWVHLVYTYTSLTRTLNVYADAVLVGSHILTYDMEITPNTNAYVGGIPGQFTSGALSTGPWSVYEKILTQEEIQSLYHSTRDNSMVQFGNTSFQYGKSLTSGAQLYGGGTETVITQVGETPINKYIGIGWYSDTADRVVPTVVRGESIWPTSFGSGGTRFMYEKDSVRVNILSDTWVHLVYTYTSLTRTLNVYADAVLVGSHILTYDMEITPNTNAYVGGIPGQFTSGALSTGPWSVYEKILTQEEIQSLYHSTRDNSMVQFGNTSFQYGKSLTSGAQLYGGGTENVVTQTASTGTPSYRQTSEQIVLHVFAISYNILRIMSGMGGLAYSN
jgi:hypothetical protein